MTLILHPGPPGDAGPSAIDWALMGDSGAFEDASEALEKECLDGEAFQNHLSTKRKVWGVTCLQAEEEFVSNTNAQSVSTFLAQRCICIHTGSRSDLGF